MPKDRTKPRGKHGGRRPGAGRPEGSDNALPKGAVEALKALNHRVPKDAHPELAAIANTALLKLVDVMNEKIHFSAAHGVLKAAAMVRHEVCGPLAERQELTGKDGESLNIRVVSLADEADE